MTCADCGSREVIDPHHWGRWGHACPDCAEAWRQQTNRYLPPLAEWLRTQRSRSDAVGSFARYCDAARINPSDDRLRLVAQFVRLELPHAVQDAGLAAHDAWMREGWTAP